MNTTESPIQQLMRQKMLLQMEYAVEKEAFRQQTETLGLARKVKRGDVWWPVTVGKSFYNSLNQPSLEIFRTEDQDVEHNFEYGKPVMFLIAPRKTEAGGNHSADSDQPEGTGEAPNVKHSDKKKSKIKYLRENATVSYVEGDRMVVTFANNLSLADLTPITEAASTPQGRLGVQLSFDETSYRLMFDALDRVTNAHSGRLAYLRDLFYTHQRAQRFSFAPTHFPWLNDTQERAVNEVLWAKDVMVVHGPPGTGKTTTLVEAIYETLKRESQVMVCAQSNMAVDWISEKLVDRGVPVLRIGNPTRVNDKMLSFTYERLFADHPDYPQLWAMRKAIRELRSHRKGRSDNWHQKMERLKSRAMELEIRINAEIFGNARVIACTLTGAANRLLEGQKYTTLFIDEAAQALEAACWIPIRKCSRVILAGDHCQLPPTVKSIAALKAGLGKTLMERIVENKPEVVTLLKMQYRMNDDIMRFSSDWFYHGEVVSAPEVRFRGILDYDQAIEWITPEDNEELTSNSSLPTSNSSLPTSNSRHGETFIGSTFGRINKAEAEETLGVLERYFTKIGKERILEDQIDVGVISPYRAQVQYLRSLIMKRPFFKPYRKLISVNTVDGFQGQERDIIVISLVRSNDSGEIGFLRDLRRMNVAITRARMKLIILGDIATLGRHPFYKKLYEYIKPHPTISKGEGA